MFLTLQVIQGEKYNIYVHCGIDKRPFCGIIKNEDAKILQKFLRRNRRIFWGVKKMDYRMFYAELFSGQHDGEVENMIKMLVARRKHVSAGNSMAKFVTFNVGDKVKFVDNVRPKYLSGKFAKVVDKKSKNIVIQLETSVGKYRAGGNITCPVSLLEKV